MAEVTRKRTGELIRKLFDILISVPNGLQAREALDNLRGQIQLTDYEKGTYKGGESRFEQIVRFATVDCVKAGWLTKHKGRWTITEEGKKAHQSFTDPEAFYRRAVKLYHEWKSSQPGGDTDNNENNDDKSNAKTVSITFEQAEEDNAPSPVEGVGSG